MGPHYYLVLIKMHIKADRKHVEEEINKIFGLPLTEFITIIRIVGQDEGIQILEVLTLRSLGFIQNIKKL